MEISRSSQKIKNATTYKLANEYQHEFIAANLQTYDLDGTTAGVRALYVRFPVLQDQDFGHPTIETEIPQEPVFAAVQIEKKPLLHHFRRPCIIRDIRCSLLLICVWPASLIFN
jgi:hypothetical protein